MLLLNPDPNLSIFQLLTLSVALQDLRSCEVEAFAVVCVCAVLPLSIRFHAGPPNTRTQLGSQLTVFSKCFFLHF